jgi:hypothetical protein
MSLFPVGVAVASKSCSTESSSHISLSHHPIFAHLSRLRDTSLALPEPRDGCSFTGQMGFPPTICLKRKYFARDGVWGLKRRGLEYPGAGRRWDIGSELWVYSVAAGQGLSRGEVSTGKGYAVDDYRGKRSTWVFPVYAAS